MSTHTSLETYHQSTSPEFVITVNVKGAPKSGKSKFISPRNRPDAKTVNHDDFTAISFSTNIGLVSFHMYENSDKKTRSTIWMASLTEKDNWEYLEKHYIVEPGVVSVVCATMIDKTPMPTDGRTSLNLMDLLPTIPFTNNNNIAVQFMCTHDSGVLSGVGINGAFARIGGAIFGPWFRIVSGTS
jgi:hypothetical protein